MGWDLLSDIGAQALASALRGAAARHRALAHNIANADTPGFIRGDARFEEALGLALQRARRAPPRAGEILSAAVPPIERDWSRPPRADGNNIAIDREMVALAENALRFQAAAEALSSRVRMVRSALQGPRR